MRPYRVMLVAAEASGDALGGALAGALRERLGVDLRLVGVGGPRMAEQGISSPFDIRALSVLGVVDALRAYPTVLRLTRETARLAAREKPDLVVLIDSWGFTLRVARALHRIEPRPFLIKYVAPQVWATRPGRAHTLARAVDRLLTIHAFDAPYFERAGLPVTFVGNPVLQRDFSRADPTCLRAQFGIAPHLPLLLLLPGSRRGEVDRLLPPFEEAVARLKSERPDLCVVLAAAEPLADYIKTQVAGWSQAVRIVEGEALRFSAMRAATVAVACSGTVTTELALAGCPMVVTYRLGPITYAVVRRLIRTPYITLLNVAAQAPVAPELIQDACTGADVARAVARRLDDPALRARQIAAQTAALELMRGGVDDPIGAATDAVIESLRARCMGEPNA